MQVFLTLFKITCNMHNMQNNMHDMQNMQTSFPICRICTAHFADAWQAQAGLGTVTNVTDMPACQAECQPWPWQWWHQQSGAPGVHIYDYQLDDTSMQNMNPAAPSHHDWPRFCIWPQYMAVQGGMPVTVSRYWYEPVPWRTVTLLVARDTLTTSARPRSRSTRTWKLKMVHTSIWNRDRAGCMYWFHHQQTQFLLSWHYYTHYDKCHKGKQVSYSHHDYYYDTIMAPFKLWHH